MCYNETFQVEYKPCSGWGILASCVPALTESGWEGNISNHFRVGSDPARDLKLKWRECEKNIFYLALDHKVEYIGCKLSKLNYLT